MQDYIFGCIYGLPFFFFLHIKLNNNDLTTTATNTSWPPALLLRISLSRKISCFLFCPYFEREREREFYSFGQCLLHRYFWVHLWPALFFFLHIKLNNNDLTTATNTSWPPALLLRISFSRKKRILLSRKISCFLFCPYFERERERESSTLLDSVYCIDIFRCI